jgi:hypothetical protein
MQVAVVTSAPTGPWAVAMWVAFGFGGIARGLLSREFRKGRFEQGDVITSPRRIVLERILWCVFGLFCVYIGWRTFRGDI